MPPSSPNKTLVALLALGWTAGAPAAPADRTGWDETSSERRDTSEAELLVRTGDIDNLGFGWPPGFDPFSGADTPPHRFPWDPDPADPDGTDRIMVVSSYRYPVRHGVDGYTSDTRRPANAVQPITLRYELRGVEVGGALIQLFVDDFQAARHGTRFRVRWDGEPAPFLEAVLAPMDQHGPIGKLLTVRVPDTHLAALGDGELVLRIDDGDTGVGDGYAIDFVRLLINPRTLDHVGIVAGEVLDAASGEPVEGVTLTSAGTSQAITDGGGRYTLADVPAGLAVITATAPGYLPTTQTVDLQSGDLSDLSFDLQVDPAGGPPAAPPPGVPPPEATPEPSPEPPMPPPRPILEVLGELPWGWIAPVGLGSLALLVFVVAGFLRPHAFDPSASVRIAGSRRGLSRAPDQRLVELPGGRPGFWRHARVAVTADGSMVRRAGRAVVVLRAGPRGATAFVRGAGLACFERRSRRWRTLTTEELAAGFESGKTYRAGDLYLTFG